MTTPEIASDVEPVTLSHGQTPSGLEIIGATPEGFRGPPLLFIHGAFAGAWCWAERWLPWLVERGRAAWAVSLRGHGASLGAEGIQHHRLSDYIDDVAEVAGYLEQAMGQPPILVGHSMGGFVVQKYLARLGRELGRRVPGVALLASVPPQGLAVTSAWMMWSRPLLSQQMGLMMMGGPRLAARLGTPDALQKALFAGEIADEHLTRWFPRFQRESGRVVLDMSLLDPLQLWRMPRPPMLVLGVRQDAFIPPPLVHLTAMTYGVQDVVLPRLGHALMLDERWEDAAQAVLDWADGL